MKIKYIHLTLLLFLYSITFIAKILYAEDKNLSLLIYDNMVVKKCKISKYSHTLDKMPLIYSTNNLRKRTGSTFIAKGKNIILIGKVLDKNCLPISDVRVDIWHADSYGFLLKDKGLKNIHSQHLGDSILYTQENKKINLHKNKTPIDPAFTGSGSTITSNFGNFYFLTILPGKLHKQQPYINIKTHHKDFKDFSCYALLSKDKRGNKVNDNVFYYERTNNDGDDIYVMYIILSQKNKYKQY